MFIEILSLTDCRLLVFLHHKAINECLCQNLSIKSCKDKDFSIFCLKT